MPEKVAAVVIGRNEGERLLLCLRSLHGQVDPIIYVDSGSTDGSVAAAHAEGAKVVELNLSTPFTAARARNAGLAEVPPDVGLIQFLDGDCELRTDWIGTAIGAIELDERIAAVCGRRRERHPEASFWNRMIDAEWDTPVGEAKACGGDALIRRKALEDVGGYRDDLIAGEEPELCFRMRQRGWRVLRIDAEMTLHDAAMTRFGQWWRRSGRAGHAYAEGALLHWRNPERYNVRETVRALMWGAALPLFVVLGGIFLSPWMLLVALAWPLQVLRLSRRLPVEQALFLTIAKLPEALGAIGAIIQQITGRRRRLIEYK